MNMNGDSNGIFVVNAGSDLFVRVVGRGTYQNSQPLRQHGTEMLQHDCREFFIDLARCQGMDSTFLGVIAGFGLSLRRSRPDARLHILNASERNQQSLCSLGLDRLVQMDAPESTRPLPPETDFQKLPGSDVSQPAKSLEKQAAAKLMLDAHEALCRADERNEAKFKDVKETLHAKITSQGNPPKNN